MKIISVEPESSPVLSTGVVGKHKIQGVGAGFVPQILDRSAYDEVIAVTDEDAFATCRLIGRKEGVLVGISSGAAIWAAIEIAKRSESEDKKIVVLLPDAGDRYLLTRLFSNRVRLRGVLEFQLYHSDSAGMFLARIRNELVMRSH